MRKSLFLLFILSIMCDVKICSQTCGSFDVNSLCGTVTESYGPSCNVSDYSIDFECNMFRVPVKIWNNSNQTSNSSILSALTVANNIFANSNIELYQADPISTLPSIQDVSYSDFKCGAQCQNFFTGDIPIMDQLIDQYIASTTYSQLINIVIVDFSDCLLDPLLPFLNETAGFAHFPGNNSNLATTYINGTSLVNEGSQDFTLTHELGHIFGLFHTFETTFGSGNTCSTGDGILDTPFDPQIDTESDCFPSDCDYDGSQIVSCGLFNPSLTCDQCHGTNLLDMEKNMENIMSYYLWSDGNNPPIFSSCPNRKFEPGQYKKINDVLMTCRSGLCFTELTQHPIIEAGLGEVYSLCDIPAAISASTTDDEYRITNCNNIRWSVDGLAAFTGETLDLTDWITSAGSYQICFKEVGIYNPSCESPEDCINIVVTDFCGDGCVGTNEDCNNCPQDVEECCNDISVTNTEVTCTNGIFIVAITFEGDGGLYNIYDYDMYSCQPNPNGNCNYPDVPSGTYTFEFVMENDSYTIYIEDDDNPTCIHEEVIVVNESTCSISCIDSNCIDYTVQCNGDGTYDVDVTFDGIDGVSYTAETFYPSSSTPFIPPFLVLPNISGINIIEDIPIGQDIVVVVKETDFGICTGDSKLIQYFPDLELSVIPNCAADEFSVEVCIDEFAALMSYTLSDGISTQMLDGGTCSILGPYSSGSIASFDLSDPSDSSCSISASTTYDCDDINTCDDGIMNNGELGVDCGGSCPPCVDCSPSFTSCPTTIAVSSDSGDNSAVVSYSIPVIDAPCDIGATPTLVSGLPSGSSFPIGLTMIIYEYDGIECSFNVIVNDNEPPDLDCGSSQIVFTEPSGCFGIVPDLTDLIDVDDNNGDPTVYQFPGPGALFGGSDGFTLDVLIIATDDDGNSSECEITLTLRDNEAPEFVNCPTDNVLLNLEPDDCVAYANWSIPAAIDNCDVTITQTMGPTPGSQLEIGTYDIEYTADDGANPPVICTFSVEVVDNQTLEFINCPTAPLVFGTDPDQCDVYANWSIPVATDNCDVIITHVSGPQPGDELPPGTYTVVYEATNNDIPPVTVTCSFDIIVNETQNPELNCPQDVTVANDIGVCEAAVPNIQLEFAFDNCPYEVTWVSAPTDVTGTGTSTTTDASGAIFPVGITTVTYTITELDDQGNGIQLATCDIIVTVIDEEPPMITCPVDATIGTSMGGVGDCEGEYTWNHPTPTDNCGVTVYTITYTNPDESIEGPTDLLGMEGASITRIFDLGLTSMLYHVEDEEGNITECTFTVLVEDDEDPMIFCEENVATNVFCIDESLDIEPNDISSIVLSVAPSMTITDVNITQLAGTQPDMGTLTATLTSPAGTTITLFSGLCPGTLDFNMALDDAAVGGIGTAGCSPLGGGTDWSSQDPLATFNGEGSAGDWTLTFDNTFIGTCGTLTDWKLEIIGNDNSPAGNRLQVVADLGTCTYKMEGLDFDPRFEDNCPDPYIRHDAIMGPFDHTLQGAVFPMGETVITWTVFDQAGNTSQCDMTIEVLDTEAPVFTNCPMPDIIQNAETGECGAYVTFSQPLATDNCDEVTVTQIDATGLNSGSVFPVGMTIMTWEAVDGTGNTEQCSLRVIVNDTQQPLFECPDDVLENMDPWQCSAIVNGIGPTVVQDNCEDNIAITYQIEYPMGSGDYISGGVVNASGEEFFGGLSEVTYKLSDQPLFLLTEVTHEIGIVNGGMDPVPPYAVLTTDDYVEVTNFGPASIDISGVKIERLNVSIPEIFCVPDGTIIPVGQTMVVHFGNGTDDPANLFFNVPCAVDMTTGQGTAYVMSFNGRVLDVVAVNGYSPIGGGTIATVTGADWSGAIPSMGGKGGVIREFSFDNHADIDWVVADVCYPITIGAVNPDLQIIPDNGTTTAMQSIMPNMVTCSFTVEVIDQELPYCGEFEEHIYDGATDLGVPTSIVGGSVYSSTISVADDFLIGDVDILNVLGQHTEVSDLTFKLTSPEGTQVVLFDGLCLGTADFDFSLDSDSLVSIINAPCDPLGQGGFFAPVTDLCAVNQAFFGEQSLGDWIFEVADSTTLDSGQLDNWELRLWEIQDYSQMDTIYANDPGDCGADFTWVHPRLIDNCKGCDGGSVELKYLTEDNIMTPSSPGFIVEADTITEFFEVGITTVRYILTDPSGNIDSCEFNVTILDEENPFVQCPQDIFIQLEGGECREVACYEPLLTADNCEVVDTMYSIEPCSYFEIGITPVTIVISDPAGNLDSCTFNVIVDEYIPDTEALVCNDHINVSLDSDCQAEISADMLFEGTEYYCYEDYIIILVDENQDTIPTGSIITQAYEGQTLTYSVVDPESGNVCWGLVTIEEKLIPEIECPPDTSILCSADKDERDLFGVLLTGEMEIISCETGVNAYYEDEIEYNEECDSPLATINRTFFLIDDEGNEVSCTQTIDILPFDFSQITWPEDLVYDCDSVSVNPELTTPELAGYPMVGDTMMLDANSICNFTHSMIDEQFWFCGGSYEIVRTWKIRNRCFPLSSTNPIIHEQLIEVLDRTEPTMHECPQDVVLSVDPWSCAGDGYLPLPELIFDSCSDVMFEANIYGGGFLEVTGSIDEGNLSIYAYNINEGVTARVVYEAFDDCGNRTECMYFITVIDDTPPTAIAKENIVVSLTSGGFDEDGTAKVFPESIDNGSHDGACGDVYLEVRRVDGSPDCGNIGDDDYNNNETFNNNGDEGDNSKDTDDGQYVKFCCDDLLDGDMYETNDGEVVLFVDSIPVILRVWDEAGNFSETWAYVRVENKLPPVITCPPDSEIGCNMDWSLHLDGPATTTEQELTMLSAPDFGTGVATGAGVCGAVSITYEDRYNEDVCYDRNNEITREWCITGTNICCDQKIDIVKVGAFDPSTISWNSGFPEAEIFETCLYDYTLQEPSWTEATCDLIAWSVATDTFYIEGNAAQFGCIKVINDYTVVDWCDDGTEYTFRQTIKVVDNDAPELVVPETCIEVGATCDAAVQLCATATDIGDCESPWLKWEILVDLYGDWTYDHTFSSYLSPLDPNFGTGQNEYYVPTSAPGDQVCIDLPTIVPGSKYDHRVVWKVSDGCGNFTSVTETFQVTDKKAPTPYCLDVSTAFMTNGSVEIWACDFVTNVEDNCSDLFKYTFTAPDTDDGFPDVELNENNCEARTYTCDDISSTNNVVMVDVYTWDECDNYALCQVELTIANNCDGSGASRIGGAIATELGKMVEEVNVSISSAQPEYPISLMTNENGEYSSEGHLIGLNYSVSAYKNDDTRNGVSTLDILLIQRHILNIQSLTSPYQYISADVNGDGNITAADLVDIRKLILEVYFKFPSNTSWRFIDAEQVLTTSNAFAFTEEIDVLAQSTNMNSEDFIASKIGDVNNSVVLSAIGNDAETRNGNLSLNLAGVSTAEGVSVEVTSANFNAIAGFQFTLNTNGQKFASIEPGVINITGDNLAVLDGNIVTMSWNTANPITVADEVLFTLNFEGSDVDKVTDMEITSRATEAEAYDANLSILNVVLESEATAEFVLKQNEPNPFSTQTKIEFSLPKAGTATLSIMDVTGKLVKQITGTYAKGWNSFVLTKADLGTEGVLLYQIESGENLATKKMILVD